MFVYTWLNLPSVRNCNVNSHKDEKNNIQFIGSKDLTGSFSVDKCDEIELFIKCRYRVFFLLHQNYFYITFILFNLYNFPSHCTIYML